MEITPADILATPDEFPDYLARIKPGFLLLQNGFAVGIIDAALSVIQGSCRSGNPANAYLPDSGQSLQNDFEYWLNSNAPLHTTAQQGRQSALPVLKSRAEASEPALRATQSAALHAGAKGYLKTTPHSASCGRLFLWRLLRLHSSICTEKLCARKKRPWRFRLKICFLFHSSRQSLVMKITGLLCTHPF